MTWVGRQRVSLLVSGIATVAVLVSMASCKKKPPTLRDPSTLPHVDRPFPNIATDVPLSAEGTRALVQCYAAALDRDATEAGILQGIYTPARIGSGTDATVKIQSGNIDERVRECVQDNADVSATEPIVIVFTLSSTKRHEPLPPGALAADNVVRRELVKAPVIVRATRLKTPYSDGIEDGQRTRDGDLEVDLEFTKTDVYEICGGIGDFMDKQGGRPPCPKVKHFQGDVITTKAIVSFTLLSGDDGWEDPYRRHWYGDELREVESN